MVITGNSSVIVGGGGIYCQVSDPSLKDVTIIGNSGANGGGIYCDYSDPVLQNVTIKDNLTVPDNPGTLHVGGGIFCYNSSPILQDVTILNNTAIADGGGIYCHENSRPSLQNVTISGNTATNDGGGIYCYELCNPSLQNLVISGNAAIGGTGGGIYSTGTPTLINSILWNNSPDEVSGFVAVSYSDIEGGWSGTGNIDRDPLFVDNFHLQPHSPCIDAGDPDPQYDDADGTIADMGAYYYDQILNPIPPLANFTADSTSAIDSLTVNFTDLSTQYTGIIDEWYWDFGDGSNSTLKNPSKEYLSYGVYTVSLTVTDTSDSTDTETKVGYITVFSDDAPAQPTDVQIDVVGDDATLSWAVVDTTFSGYPANVSAYLVYYSEIPDQDSLFFFHGLTTETTYTHPYVVQFSNFMFYQVTSFVGELKSLQNWIAEHQKFQRKELDAFIEEKKRK